ncbi:ATP-binding protein [Fusarium sp. NRRL 25303]|nr:ATP-binding protein [Fusarium sp. NRRL 25303]
MSATINLEKFCQYFGTTNVFETKRQINDLQTKYAEEPPACYDSAAVILIKQLVAKRKGNVLVFLTSVRDIEKTCAMIRREVRGLKVPPMYSSLPKHAQDLATGGSTSQVCIVATNVAEASLIIPGITYVMGMLFVGHHHRPPTKTMEKMNSLKRNESTAAEAAAIEDGKMNPFFVEQGITIFLDEWASGLLVACTQPRVVAATGVATLVAQEMDVPSGSIVGYKVSFDKQSSGATLLGFLSNELFLQQHAGLSTSPRKNDKNDNTDIFLALLKIPDFGKLVEPSGQRVGRAGGTPPGECVRLYTKKFHDLGMTSNTPAGIHMSDVS